MKKLIALLALVALALVPAAAQASTAKRAKVYKGTFEAVGADGAYSHDKFGKAQLVDGRRNDKLSVHVRRLAPRTQYAFRLQHATHATHATHACEEGAPGGTDVPDWTYRRAGVFTTNRKGHANSKARSRSFAAKGGVEYFVAVYTLGPTGQPNELVLCAELKGKKAKKGKKHGDAKGGKGRSEDRGHHKSGQGRDDKQRETKPGKREGLHKG